jgi:hypothetical protein
VLNNMSTHAVLITAVDLNSEGRVVGVEYHGGDAPFMAAVTGYGTLGSRSMDTFNTRFSGKTMCFSAGRTGTAWSIPTLRRAPRRRLCQTALSGLPLPLPESPRTGNVWSSATGCRRRDPLHHRRLPCPADRPLYTGPLELSETAVVRAIALTGHFFQSAGVDLPGGGERAPQRRPAPSPRAPSTAVLSPPAAP